jgi:structural maintenance of chromosome 1
MRNQRVGQATFIPLDTIQVKPANDKFRTFAKGVRLAVDIVEHEPAIERAIHHACGSALICDTLDIARTVCYEKGQEVKGIHYQLHREIGSINLISLVSCHVGRNCYS